MNKVIKPLKPFSFFIFVSLMTGILFGNFLPDLRISFFVFNISTLISIIVIYLKKRNYIFYVFIIIAFGFGFISIQHKLNPQLPDHHISNFLDQTKMEITGKVISQAKHYQRKKRVILSCMSVVVNNTDTKDVNGNIYFSIYGKNRNKIQFGDILTFKAKIRSTRNFSNPGGFDYKKYVEFQEIYGSAYAIADKIKVINKPNHLPLSDKIIRRIENFRILYFNFLNNQKIDSNSKKILISLVAGKKEVIDSDLRDLFSKAGISHILAISGLHLSIIASIFYFIFFRLLSFHPTWSVSGVAKKISGVLTIFPLFVYVTFSGFSPSAVRALIMIIVFMISILSEKENDLISSFSIAGILILAIDTTAIFAISFQLSFLAVFFIIKGFKLFDTYSIPIKNTYVLKILMFSMVTLLAGLGTSPLSAHYFHVVSHVQLFTNFIAIPILGFVVLPLGFLSSIFFTIFPPLSILICLLSDKIIYLIIWIAKIATSQPYSWSRVLSFSWLEIICLYLIVFIVYRFLRKKIRFWISLLIIAFISFCGLILIPSLISENQNLTISVLDIGQGNSTCIQTPNGKNIIIDGGGFSDSSSFDTGRYILAPFLWSKDISQIEYIILSHPQSDHLGGLKYIIENFKVGTLIKNNDTNDSKSYTALINACINRGVKIWIPNGNSVELIIDGTKWTFIDTFKENSQIYDLNNNSLVTKLTYNEFSMLFPGDIMQSRERHLTQKININLKSRLLLAPHHGSSTSSSKFLLDKVQPESVIVSCGWQNRYGFPSEKIVNRFDQYGIKMYRTDINGAVIISTNGNDYKILTHKGE